MTLTQFLLARIAEDQAAVPPVLVIPGDTSAVSTYWRRRLADCEAKRALMEEHDGHRWHEDGEEGCYACNDHPCRILCKLALPYADHPDYRDEWRP